MADKTIEIDIEVNGKMQKATVSTKKLRDELDGLSNAQDDAAKSAHTADRRLKGTAQTSANSTKNFSKMSQGITGGLVPAYATLAANVFAVSAAFNFFKRAAQVEQLKQSQMDYAASTGMALQSITQNLRSASQGMLGFQEAAQAAAIGSAKGFSPAQLEDLADGALRASQALGRDFADAFDRLVRGVSKAEPELLDELGITLRLETATRNYAQALGLQADALTETQRSQAVLLETQRQLDLLFQADPGEANPFVTLNKSFEDLIQTITEFFMPLFKGIASIISKNIGAAITVFGLFALSIIKAAFPLDKITKGIDDFGSRAKKEAEDARDAIDKYRASLVKTEGSAKKLRETGREELATGARKAIMEGSKSKLLQKVDSEGFEALSKRDQGQLKRYLKMAESNVDASGKIISGVFEGVSIEIIQDMNRAFKKIDTRANTTSNAIKGMMKNSVLQVKIGVARINEQFAKMAQKGVGAAKKITKAFSFVAKIATGVGIAAIFIEMAAGFARNIDSIILKLTGALDFMLSAISKFFGGQEVTVLTDKYKEHFQESVLGVQDQARAMDALKTAADDVDDGIKALTKDIQNAEQGQERFNKQIAKLKEDGEDELAAAVAARKQRAQITLLSTADVAGLLEDIDRVQGMTGIGATKEAEALRNKLVPALESLKGVVPGVAEQIAAAQDDPAALAELFKELQKEALDTVAAFTDFDSGLQTLQEDFRSGDAVRTLAAVKEQAAILTKVVSRVGEGTAEANERIQKFEDFFTALGTTSKEALERLQASLDKTREINTENQRIRVEAARIGAMQNKFAAQRAKTQNDIAKTTNGIERKTQDIADKELALLSLDKNKKAAAQEELIRLREELAAERAILGIKQEQAKFTDQISILDEKIFQLRTSQNLVQKEQELNNVLKRRVDIRKQLTDLQEDLGKAIIKDVAEQRQLANPFFDKEQFITQQTNDLQRKLLADRRANAEFENTLALKRINSEHTILDLKRRQTILEMEKLAMELDAQGTDEGSRQATIARGIADEFRGLEGQFAAAKADALIMQQRTFEASMIKFDLMENSLARSSQRATEIDALFRETSDAFESSFESALNAVFDSATDKTMDLKEKLKDIGRGLLKTIQKAVTKRLLVDPIMDQFDKLLGNESAEEEAKRRLEEASNKLGTTIDSAGDRLADKIAEALGMSTTELKTILDHGSTDLNKGIDKALSDGAAIKMECCDQTGIDRVADTLLKDLPVQTPANTTVDPFGNTILNRDPAGDIGAGGMASDIPGSMISSNGVPMFEPARQSYDMGFGQEKVQIGLSQASEQAFIQSLQDGPPKIDVGPSSEALLSQMPTGPEAAEGGGGLFGGESEGKLTEAMNRLGDLSLEQITGLGMAVTALFGNSEVGQKLQKVMALLHLVTLAQSLFEKATTPIDITTTNANTGALTLNAGMLAANTAALYANAASNAAGSGFALFKMGGIVKDAYNTGGIARGPMSGYPAILHGNEAVVPLPDGKTIPVQMSGGTGDQNNVTVNVSIDRDGNAQQSSASDSADAENMGRAISLAVQKELQNQKRSGGILSPHGVA